jgi:hypothetical protein
MHVTPNQVINMWHRIHTKIDSFGSEVVVGRLANIKDENRTRFPVYKENLEAFCELVIGLGTLSLMFLLEKE